MANEGTTTMPIYHQIPNLTTTRPDTPSAPIAQLALALDAARAPCYHPRNERNAGAGG